MTNIQNARLAILATLTERSSRLGRTALMKLCYFLQTLRFVPLGYRFTLYPYGPFDPSVLSDLACAELFGGLCSEVVLFSNGYGYEITPSGKLEAVKALAPDFVNTYDMDINWIIKHFAGSRSGDLELLSTIVYADRESESGNEILVKDGLVQKVHDVSPHFDEAYIRAKVEGLAGLRLLRSLRVPSAKSSAA